MSLLSKSFTKEAKIKKEHGASNNVKRSLKKANSLKSQKRRD